MASNKYKSPGAKERRAANTIARRGAARQAEFDFNLINAGSADTRRRVRGETGTSMWRNVNARRNSQGIGQAQAALNAFESQGRTNIERYRKGQATRAARQAEAARQEKNAARRVRDRARREAARAAAAAPAAPAPRPRGRRARSVR